MNAALLGMAWQDIAAWGIAAICGTFLAWRMFSAVRAGRKKNCGGGCSGCGSPPRPSLVNLDAPRMPSGTRAATASEKEKT